MSNEQLVIRIKAGENVSEGMEQLYNRVRRFIHAVARKCRDNEELEDQEQEGYLVPYPAIDGHDPAQGVESLTYVEYHIRQRIRRCLQMNSSCLRFPVYRLKKVQRYKCLCSVFNREYGRELSDRKAAAFMGLILEQVEDVKEDAYMARSGSLDSLVKGLDDEEDTIIGDMVAPVEDIEGDTMEWMQQEQLEAELWDYMDSLPGQQPAAIRMHFQGGMAMEVIGREYGTSGETACHTQTKVLQELRKPRYSEQLRSFLPDTDRIYSMAITGNGVRKSNRVWTSSTEHVTLDAIDWEERHRIYLELLEKVREEVVES